MAISPFDIIKHVSEKTPLDFDIKEYNPFMVTRGLSNTISTIFFAEMMNKYHELDKDIQYSFYFHGIPKGKRYGTWNKAIISDPVVELIMNKYQCNRQVAEGYFKLMNDTSIKQLQEQMNEGGRK